MNQYDTTQQTSTQSEDWLDDQFLDATFDWRSLPPDQQARFKQRFGIAEEKRSDNEFAMTPDTLHRQFRNSLYGSLRDPEVQRELAERAGPQYVAELQTREIERIAENFRRNHPEYRPTQKNTEAITKHLADKYLGGKDWLNPTQTAVELARAGHWTEQELAQAYRELFAAGELQMPEGFAKALTAREELEVISLLQTAGPGAAIVRFLDYALGSAFNGVATAEGAAEFRAKYPDLNNRAVFFVWKNLLDEQVPDEDLEQFRADVAQRHPLLSIPLLDSAWKRSGLHRSALFPDGRQQTHAPATRQELDALDDDEAEDLFQRARIEYRRQRSR